MKLSTVKLCAGIALHVGVLGTAHAGYADANPLKYTDPEGLATQAEIAAALTTLGGKYPDAFRKMPTSVGTTLLKDGFAVTDFANNILLNSKRFGDATECVPSGDEYQFLQTLAHEMLHVNEPLLMRLLSNSFRTGNPLGYYHRKLDDLADSLVTPALIESYKKTRNEDKSCTCR